MKVVAGNLGLGHVIGMNSILCRQCLDLLGLSLDNLFHPRVKFREFITHFIEVQDLVKSFA
jgi:hypothetical protein